MSYQPRFHIVLHNPEIPQNTGAVGRTCVALEAKLWLVRPLGFRVDDRTLKRAGLDYWQFLDWEAVDHWEQLLEKLGERRLWYFSRFASSSFRAVDYHPDDALIFGSETAGLPRSMISGNEDRSLRIPVGPHVRSLNLASSVAVAGYEIDRQLACHK